MPLIPVFLLRGAGLLQRALRGATFHNHPRPQTLSLDPEAKLKEEMTSPYNFNPPHPHPDHVHQPSNNAFQDPNAISNGAYDGFSSVFAGDADFVGVGDEGWVYQPDRLSAPSLGFGDHQSLYHNAYADTQGAQLQNAGFGAESAFSNFHQIPLDPSLNNADARNPTNTPSAFAAPDNANGGTIAPEALQNRISPPKLKVESPQTQAVTPNETESLAKTSPPVLPSGSRVGKFLVISPDTLSQIANSRPLAKFVSVGNTPYDVPITKCELQSGPALAVWCFVSHKCPSLI